MEPEFELVKQCWTDGIDVRDRQIPHLIVGRYWKARRGGSAEIGCRERRILVAVRKKESARELAVCGMNEVDVDYELIFVESRRFTEARESPQRKRLCGVDRLRGGDHETAVGKFEVEQIDRLLADVRAVGGD